AAERPEHFLQKRSLAGAWARHQADDVRACHTKPLPKGAGGAIVMLQNVLSNLDQTRMFAHGSISRATSSSSRPVLISGVGPPQTGQHSSWSNSSVRTAEH